MTENNLTESTVVNTKSPSIKEMLVSGVGVLFLIVGIAIGLIVAPIVYRILGPQ